MVTKDDKIKQVEKLAEGIKESRVVVFADYSGVSVSEMNDLRSKLSEIGAHLKVAKNTLIKLAAEGAKLPMEEVTGPTAVLLSMGADPIESVKVIVEAFKERGKVKFGVFEEKLYDASGIGQLALIPDHDQLRGRLASSLAAPIYRFVYSLLGNQRSLVRVLRVITDAKGVKDR